MKLKNAFFLPLLLALALAAGAQTNSNGGGTPPARPTPQNGIPLDVPRVRATTPPTLPVRAAVPPSPTTVAAVAAETASPSAALAALSAPPLPAAPPEVADISYNINMPVDEVLDIYAKLVGRTALHTSSGPMGVPGSGIIALKTQSPLTHSEAIQALETILGMNGITIVPIGDKFFKVVSEATAPVSGGAPDTNSASGLPTSGKFITEIVQLKYADPQQVVDALGKFAKSQNSIIFIPSTQSLILRDYTENVKRMLEMLEKIDVSSPLIVKPRVIPIKYALASDIASALSQLGAGAGGSVGKSTTGAHSTSSTSGSSSGFGGAGPGGSTIPGQSTQTGLSAGAGGSRSNFGARLGSIVNNATAGGSGGFSLFGQTKIIADERTNSLLVFANDDDMKMIQEIIDKLDVVLAQVLIEAVILEVNLTDGQTTAFSVAQNQLSSGKLSGAGGINNIQNAGSFLSGSSAATNGGTALSVLPSLPGAGQFTYFGKYGNDLDAVLEAVASDSRISVLSRPRIQTSHAVEAELFIGNTVPYVTGTYNYGYGSGPSSQYTEKEVGIRLKVTPLINQDGLVVMDIDQEIEQLGPSVQIEGVGAVPTTTKRDAGSKVAVYSGQTIILGGFISASRQNATSGVPWLMNIPVLGNLFKSTVIANTRTELIVLMRPTVLPTPQIAAKVAMDEKHKMAAVEQAELEIRADEDKRNADAAAELKKAEEKALKAAGKSGTNAPVNVELDDDGTQTNSPAQSAPQMP